MHNLKSGAYAAWILTWIHLYYSNALTAEIEGPYIFNSWHYNGLRDVNKSQQNMSIAHRLQNHSQNNRGIPSQDIQKLTTLDGSLLDNREGKKHFHLDLKKVPRNNGSKKLKTIIRIPRKKFRLLPNKTLVSLPANFKWTPRRTVNRTKNSKTTFNNTPFLVILPSDVIRLKNKTSKTWKIQNATKDIPQYVRIKKSNSAPVTYECNIMACPGNSTPSEICLPLCAPKRTAPKRPPLIKHPLPTTKMPIKVTKPVPPPPPKHIAITAKPLYKSTPLRRPYPPEPGLPIEAIKRVSPSPKCIDHQVPSVSLPKLTTPMPYIPERFISPPNTIPIEQADHVRPSPHTLLAPQIQTRHQFPMQKVSLPPRTREQKVIPPIAPLKPYRPYLSYKFLDPQIPDRNYMPHISRPPPQMQWQQTPKPPSDPIEVPGKVLSPVSHLPPQVHIKEILHPHQPIKLKTAMRKIPPTNTPEIRIPIKIPHSPFPNLPAQVPFHSYQDEWILPQIIKRPLLHTDIPVVPHIPPKSPYPYLPIPIPDFPFRFYQKPLKQPPQIYLNEISPIALVPQQLPTRTLPPPESPFQAKVPFRHYPTVTIPPKEVPEQTVSLPANPIPQVPLYPEFPMYYRPAPKTPLKPIVSTEHPIPPQNPTRASSTDFHIPPQINTKTIISTISKQTPQVPDRPETTTNTVPVNIMHKITSIPSRPPPQIKTVSPLKQPCSLKSGIKLCVSQNHDHDEHDHVHTRHIVPVAEDKTAPWPQVRQNVSVDWLSTVNLTENEIEVYDKERSSEKLHKYKDVDKIEQREYFNMSRKIPNNAKHKNFENMKSVENRKNDTNITPLILIYNTEQS